MVGALPPALAERHRPRRSDRLALVEPSGGLRDHLLGVNEVLVADLRLPAALGALIEVRGLHQVRRRRTGEADDVRVRAWIDDAPERCDRAAVLEDQRPRLATAGR